MAKKPVSNLNKLLKAYTPIARSGSRANNRLSFQEAWSLKKILEVHNVTPDYLASFDFLDDFVIFEDVAHYEQATFFQIKTKDPRNWTFTNFTTKKKGHSILSKIFKNFTTHKKILKKATLVVNGTLEVSSTQSYPEEVELRILDLSPTEQNKIFNKINVPQRSVNRKLFGTIFSVNTTDLSLDEEQRDLIIRGLLSKFIDNTFPERPYMVKPIFECLKAEVIKRSNYEKAVPNEAILKEKKSLSKEQITGFISSGISRTENDDWQNVKNRLSNEGVSLLEIKNLTKGYTDYTTTKACGSPILEHLILTALPLIEEEEAAQSQLNNLINAVYTKLIAQHTQQQFSEKFLKAMIAYEYQKKR